MSLMSERKPRFIVTLCGGLLLAILPNTARADLITFTTSGTINAGFDSNGFFGAPTSTSEFALVGASYTLSITFDTTVNDITASADRTELDNPIGGTAPGGGVVVATVNGVTKTFPFLALVVDQFFVDDSLHQGVAGGADEVFGQVDSRDNKGILDPTNNILTAKNDFFSLKSSFLSSANFDQPFSFTLANPPYQSSGVHFDFTDNSGSQAIVTDFDGSPSSATLTFSPTGGTNPVPEPSSLFVFTGSVLLLLGRVWRSRSTRL